MKKNPGMIRRLLFSGGGVRAIAFLGVLEQLDLKSIKEFCGVSAGSLIALMLAIGYSIETMKKLCLEFDFGQIPMLDESMLLFYDQLGFDTGEKLERLIKSLLKHRGISPECTFAEFPKQNLRVWATDLESLALVEMSAKKTPNLPIWIAIRASMAFPIYFTPIRHPETNHWLVDGGVLNNYPIGILEEFEQKETLGVTFDFENSEKEITNILDYVLRILSGLSRSQNVKTMELFQHQTIRISCLEFPALHFQITMEERFKLIEKGKEAAAQFLAKKRPVQRRHSVS